MKLADKNCYPVFNNEGLPTRSDQAYGNEGVPFAMGLTFRERLIIALAGNPNVVQYGGGNPLKISAERIILYADAIIKEMGI